MKQFLKRLNLKIKNNRFLSNCMKKLFLFSSRIEYVWFDFIWSLKGLKMPTEPDIAYFRENVTFIYKSFERQKLAIRLFHNIQKYYPGVHVIIADDSSKPLVINGYEDCLTIIQLPFNSGCLLV